MRKHNALQKKRDDIDSKKILRTSFQWLYAVILLLFGFVILFTVVFKAPVFLTFLSIHDTGAVYETEAYQRSGFYTSEEGNRK